MTSGAPGRRCASSGAVQPRSSRWRLAKRWRTPRRSSQHSTSGDWSCASTIPTSHSGQRREPGLQPAAAGRWIHRHARRRRAARPADPSERGRGTLPADPRRRVGVDLRPAAPRAGAGGHRRLRTAGRCRRAGHRGCHGHGDRAPGEAEPRCTPRPRRLRLTQRALPMPRPPRRLGLSTLAVTGGASHREADTPVVQPLVQSANLLQEIGTADGLRYPRYGNAPNAEVLQTRLALMEGAEAAIVLSSGMGATACALLALLRPGDHLLASSWVYGGTRTLFTQEFATMGIDVTLV